MDSTTDLLVPNQTAPNNSLITQQIYLCKTSKEAPKLRIWVGNWVGGFQCDGLVCVHQRLLHRHLLPAMGYWCCWRSVWRTRRGGGTFGGDSRGTELLGVSFLHWQARAQRTSGRLRRGPLLDRGRSVHPATEPERDSPTDLPEFRGTRKLNPDGYRPESVQRIDPP